MVAGLLGAAGGRGEGGCRPAEQDGAGRGDTGRGGGPPPPLRGWRVGDVVVVVHEFLHVKAGRIPAAACHGARRRRGRVWGVYRKRIPELEPVDPRKRWVPGRAADGGPALPIGGGAPGPSCAEKARVSCRGCGRRRR